MTQDADDVAVVQPPFVMPSQGPGVCTACYQGRCYHCTEAGCWCPRCVLNDGSMPGGGDTVFGVPSRHGRENFPPASGTDTPLVASGEQNESDSQEKRQIDGGGADGA